LKAVTIHTLMVTDYTSDSNKWVQACVRNQKVLRGVDRGRKLVAGFAPIPLPLASVIPRFKLFYCKNVIRPMYKYN